MIMSDGAMLREGLPWREGAAGVSFAFAAFVLAHSGCGEG